MVESKSRSTQECQLDDWGRELQKVKRFGVCDLPTSRASRLIRRCRDLQIPIDKIRKLVKGQAFGSAPCDEVELIARIS